MVGIKQQIGKGMQKIGILSIQDTRQSWFGWTIWIPNFDKSSWAKGPAWSDYG